MRHVLRLPPEQAASKTASIKWHYFCVLMQE